MCYLAQYIDINATKMFLLQKRFFILSIEYEKNTVIRKLHSVEIINARDSDILLRKIAPLCFSFICRLRFAEIQKRHERRRCRKNHVNSSINQSS